MNLHVHHGGWVWGLSAPQKMLVLHLLCGTRVRFKVEKMRASNECVCVCDARGLRFQKPLYLYTQCWTKSECRANESDRRTASGIVALEERRPGDDKKAATDVGAQSTMTPVLYESQAGYRQNGLRSGRKA